MRYVHHNKQKNYCLRSKGLEIDGYQYFSGNDEKSCSVVV